MKRIAASLLVLILFLLAPSLYGGEKGNRQGGQMSPERMARMQERLGLTDEQVQQMQEIRANGGSRKDMRAVLTDEQRATLDELRRNRQARRGQGKDRPAPPATNGESADSENG